MSAGHHLQVEKARTPLRPGCVWSSIRSRSVQNSAPSTLSQVRGTETVVCSHTPTTVKSPRWASLSITCGYARATPATPMRSGSAVRRAAGAHRTAATSICWFHALAFIVPTQGSPPAVCRCGLRVFLFGRFRVPARFSIGGRPADLFAGDRLAVHRPPCVPDVGCDEGDQ